MSALPLEDNFNDIVSKAMRGLKLNAAQVAEKAGLSPQAVESLAGGDFDATTARKVAPVLGLDAEALVVSGEKGWRPEPVEAHGLAQFTTPWEDMMVNSYVVWDPASLAAIVFDSGADATPMLDLVQQQGLKVGLIALTHTHGDHVFDLDRLKSRTGAPAFVSEREPLDGAESFSVGKTFTAGKLRVETRLTWGHSKGGITYVVLGLERTVAIVGDAIFAGSMGGGMVSYGDALESNRTGIFTLPDETVLCPGHGPLTTVGEERRHNPFFAGTR